MNVRNRISVRPMKAAGLLAAIVTAFTANAGTVYRPEDAFLAAIDSGATTSVFTDENGGRWTFGYMTEAAMTAVTPFTTAATPKDNFSGFIINGFPYAVINTSTSQSRSGSYSCNQPVPGHGLVLQPGDRDTLRAGLRFQPPTGGKYRVTATLKHLAPSSWGEGSVKGLILAHNTELASATAVTTQDPTAPTANPTVSIEADVWLAAGAPVTLAVDPNGTCSSDGTYVTFAVEALETAERAFFASDVITAAVDAGRTPGTTVDGNGAIWTFGTCAKENAVEVSPMAKICSAENGRKGFSPNGSVDDAPKFLVNSALDKNGDIEAKEFDVHPNNHTQPQPCSAVCFRPARAGRYAVFGYLRSCNKWTDGLIAKIFVNGELKDSKAVTYADNAVRPVIVSAEVDVDSQTPVIFAIDPGGTYYSDACAAEFWVVEKSTLPTFDAGRALCAAVRDGTSGGEFVDDQGGQWTFGMTSRAKPREVTAFQKAYTEASGFCGVLLSKKPDGAFQLPYAFVNMSGGLLAHGEDTGAGKKLDPLEMCWVPNSPGFAQPQTAVKFTPPVYGLYRIKARVRALWSQWGDGVYVRLVCRGVDQEKEARPPVDMVDDGAGGFKPVPVPGAQTTAEFAETVVLGPRSPAVLCIDPKTGVSCDNCGVGFTATLVEERDPPGFNILVK